VKLAFALFTYFPYGGLTKDLLTIARLCQERGHSVKVFAESCRGEQPKDIELTLVPVNALSNHVKNRRFSQQLQQELNEFEADLLVGFNKMPGLDVYYAADGCFVDKSRQRGWWYRLMPRSRHFELFEKAVFAKDSATQILMIAERQIAIYQKYYATPSSRFHLLPPGISRDRIAPENAEQKRLQLRQHWQFNEEDRLVLMVGSGFRTKGLDRSITALAALPGEQRLRTRLFVIGHDNEKAFVEQAESLGLAGQVSFLSGRDDVPDFLLAADLLIHPAYRENTGTVLIEAMVAGLPVLTTDICGYAHYVRENRMGAVIPSPFDQSLLNRELQRLLFVEDRAQWQQRGKAFAQRADIYDMPLRAVELIEQFGKQKPIQSPSV
jgi:UDP-glucose:(heptosyl)LPS alpha-1,3-glucosyltransferase